MIRQVPLEQEEVAALDARVASRGAALTVSEVEAARAAGQALERARELDPENAAPHYMLAYIALAQHSHDKAFANLRTALQKGSWDLYQREASIAIYDTACAFLPPFEASSQATSLALSWNGLIGLARALTAMANKAEAEAIHTQAVLIRESQLHLVNLMLAAPYRRIDTLTAVTMWLIAASSPEADEDEPDFRPQDDNIIETSEVTAATAALSSAGANLAHYFRRHGREDLAAKADRSTPYVEAAYREVDRVRERQAAAGISNAFSPRAVQHLSLALAALLVALSVLGLTTSCLRLAGHPLRAIEWPTWAWILLIVGCLASGYALGLVWPFKPVLPMSRLVWELHHRLDATYEPRWELREWGLYFALVSLPVMLLATLVVVVVHRRRRHGGPYIGPVGQYVGTLLGLLLPLTALTAIALLCVSIPAARQAREWANINHTIIHEGELDHYAVTAPSVP
jgi:hypothetical protein